MHLCVLIIRGRRTVQSDTTPCSLIRSRTPIACLDCSSLGSCRGIEAQTSKYLLILRREFPVCDAPLQDFPPEFGSTIHDFGLSGDPVHLPFLLPLVALVSSGSLHQNQTAIEFRAIVQCASLQSVPAGLLLGPFRHVAHSCWRMGDHVIGLGCGQEQGATAGLLEPPDASRSRRGPAPAFRRWHRGTPSPSSR